MVGSERRRRDCAGTPQLIMPMSHDQPDNALHVERLGCGSSITPKKFTGRLVADALEQLLDENGPIPARCQDISRRFREVHPLAETCELIEQLGDRPSPCNLPAYRETELGGMSQREKFVRILDGRAVVCRVLCLLLRNWLRFAPDSTRPWPGSSSAAVPAIPTSRRPSSAEVFLTTQCGKRATSTWPSSRAMRSSPRASDWSVGRSHWSKNSNT